jgi:hypothetical protein
VAAPVIHDVLLAAVLRRKSFSTTKRMLRPGTAFIAVAVIAIIAALVIVAASLLATIIAITGTAIVSIIVVATLCVAQPPSCQSEDHERRQADCAFHEVFPSM